MKITILTTLGVLVAVVILGGAVRSRSIRSANRHHPSTQQPAGTVLSVVRPVGGHVSSKDAALEEKIERLRRWVFGREPKMKRDEAMKILTEWSEFDARGALEFVVNAPHFPRRNMACAVPLGRICRGNPREAIAWIAQNITLAPDRGDIGCAILRNIEADAPLAALELADAPEIPIDSHWFGELLGRVARINPQIATASFAQKSPEARRQIMGMMLNYWSETDPAAALAWYTGQPEKNLNAALTLASGCLKMGGYSIADLKARLHLDQEDADALLWRLARDGMPLDANSLAGFSERARRRAATIAAGNLEESPEQVLAFVRSVITPEKQAEALVDGFSSWMESDRKAASAWLDELPDRTLADALKMQLELEHLRRDPRDALAKAATIVNLQERKKLVERAVDQLSWSAPDEAANWVAQHPGDNPDAGTVENITMRYLEKDDAAAMAWLVKLGAGENRDEALGAAARYWVGKEDDFATASMAAISDEQKRERCMFLLYHSMAENNQLKADQWLASQGLSPEVRKSWQVLGVMPGIRTY